ncbi:MAG: hypothetical protein R2761_27955 [Acidimicrobiales bacterium]
MIDWHERGNASEPTLEVAAGRRQVERVVASIAFSATSFLVVGTLAADMEPRRYAAVGLVWVTASVANNVVRYGLFDATLAGRVSMAACRFAAERLALIVLGITTVATLAVGTFWSDPLAAAVVAGAGLNLTADLARMVRLCAGHDALVARRDAAWLAATALLAGITWATGAGAAVGSVGGWIAGGAGWTVLALRAGRPAVTTQTGSVACWPARGRWRPLVPGRSSATCLAWLRWPPLDVPQRPPSWRSAGSWACRAHRLLGLRLAVVADSPAGHGFPGIPAAV